MADVTVKRLDEFEAIFGGGFRRVRAGLGVNSFGLSVMDFPPGFTQYPEHDHGRDGQEEVYTVLSGSATLTAGGQDHELVPGVFARVGPREARRLSTGDDGGPGARDRRRSRPGLRCALVQRGGRAGPDDGLSGAFGKPARSVLGRRASGTGPGPRGAGSPARRARPRR